ncbi:MAG: type II toxin-antitoxin system prevent-host-death family antitoxin [Nitrospirae bacterium]|nr:type II toxin-antitoxin system prevent-host-death family antitoxin [Nitrospirota bacterium]
MQMVGVKELKDRLTYYLGLTKEGDNVVVTDRGVPIAILHSLDTVEEGAGTEERLASLAKRGMVRLPLKKGFSSPVERPAIKGEPLSKTVIEDRK